MLGLLKVRFLQKQSIKKILQFIKERKWSVKYRNISELFNFLFITYQQIFHFLLLFFFTDQIAILLIKNIFFL